MTSNPTPEKSTASVVWLSTAPLRRFWTSCRLTFSHVSQLALSSVEGWRQRKNITRQIIPADGWSAIYKQHNFVAEASISDCSFIIQRLVFFDIAEENGEFDASGLAWSINNKEELISAVQINIAPLLHNGCLENVEDNVGFIGYLAPGQTLDEWLALARENGVDYEETTKTSNINSQK